MILATHRCGCPATNQSNQHGRSIKSKPICSSCCEHSPLSYPQKSRCQTSPGLCPPSRLQEETPKVTKHLRCPQSPCCASTLSPPFLPGDSMFRVSCLPSSPSRIQASRPDFSNECASASKPIASKSVSKSNFQGSNVLGDRVMSDIVKNGQPFKEIEAIINDNRLVLRMQSETPEPEYDPPCDCLAEKNPLEDGDDVTSGKAGFGGDSSGAGCRTVTLYPQPGSEVNSGLGVVQSASNNEKKDKKDKCEKSKSIGVTNTEENPNIFFLRIRKKCDVGDKKRSIDLEFRTPRPWSASRPPIDETCSIGQRT
ncbi:hypothetical protein KM043_006844 [Ampulex compressa]|nr:hypothetical protein KM043_006844 [Ampulex compressa]